MGMFVMTPDQLTNTGARSWHRPTKAGTPPEVKDAVTDYAWQMFRGCRLKGQPTIVKLLLLERWLDCWRGTPYEALARVQVENYLGALKRGGFIIDDDRARGEVPGEEFGGAFWAVVK
jgi:hypothetical protein